ncbi:MAG: peroxide stress protein YaaA [Thermodesulfobacteriales bacterium]|nr:MAG: peroxide stress protein YaaA [Thermodesulfobacteriales bacterium]
MDRYDWDGLKKKLLEKYRAQLDLGEHIIITEDESDHFFGKSIKSAMPGKCILEEGINPKKVVPTIPKHLGLLGYSSRVGLKNNRKYVEIWAPKNYQSKEPSETKKQATQKKYVAQENNSESDDNRLNHINEFYALLDKLIETNGIHQLSTFNSKLPDGGVYFFFESSERRENSRNYRVVRVGTHAVSIGSKATLWDRLRTHRGHKTGEYAGGGNHRASVFRKLVGEAILNKNNLNKYYTTWGVDESTDTNLKEKEHPLELAVSHHVGEMYFTWVQIEDEPSKNSLRKTIEQNAIALLSNTDKLPINPQSKFWLGNWSPNEDVTKSGLWNSNHTKERYSPNFIDKLNNILYPQTIEKRSHNEEPNKTLIIIPCSGKKAPGSYTYSHESRRVIDYLPQELQNSLSSLRQSIAENFGLPFGPDLGPFDSMQNIGYLPAYKRYSGNIYSKISQEDWDKLGSGKGYDLIIISALYGLIFWDEPIRNYNVTMKQTLNNGYKLKTNWKYILPQILASIIKTNGYSKVHELLSTDYREALQGYRQIIRNDGVEVIVQDLSEYRSGSDYYRGETVNNLILGRQS